jgi:hypothetical protein
MRHDPGLAASPLCGIDWKWRGVVTASLVAKPMLDTEHAVDDKGTFAVMTPRPPTLLFGSNG